MIAIIFLYLVLWAISFSCFLVVHSDILHNSKMELLSQSRLWSSRAAQGGWGLTISPDGTPTNSWSAQQCQNKANEMEAISHSNRLKFFIICSMLWRSFLMTFFVVSTILIVAYIFT